MKLFKFLSKLIGLSAFQLISLVLLHAQVSPPWWGTYGAIDENLVEAPHSPVTLGQFKHFASKAKEYIDAELGTLPTDWDNAYPVGTNPFPFSVSDADYTLVQQGQAKFVLDGIYNVLIDAEVNTTAALNAYIDPANNWTHSRPWTDNLEDDAHNSPLLEGQLKWMLSFDLTTFPPAPPPAPVDEDEDFIPDDWEIQYYGDLSADFESDYDGDKITDSFEFQAGTNPLVDETIQADKRMNYDYDNVGNLESSNGLLNFNYNFDNEGNLNSAN